MEKKKVRVGYQGMENSNNHRAALELSGRHEDWDADLIPMVSSANVTAALWAREIDYGVMAVSTDVAGAVEETARAMSGAGLQMADEVSIDIHHCLFKRKEEISVEDIRVIASHVEAIRECTETIEREFPGREFLAVPDTAMAAWNLGRGELPEDTAVICSLAAGMQNGLCLVKENVEDLEHNGTTFGIFYLPE